MSDGYLPIQKELLRTVPDGGDPCEGFKQAYQQQWKAPRRLLPEWADNLPLQQQAVLVLALRGPDGFPKYHPSKDILCYLRAAILAAASFGRHLKNDEKVGSLMTLDGFLGERWYDALHRFRNVEDELPLHYYTHLMHAAQVVAYKHPDSCFRERWAFFYQHCCDYLHTHPESEAEMDTRLNDFGRALDEVR